MKRLKDPNHVPVAPKAWKDPHNGHKIYWQSDRVPFLTFLGLVSQYWKANYPGEPEPTREHIENEICQQMPPWACVGEGYHRPATENTRASAGGRSGGCKSCGHR